MMLAAFWALVPGALSAAILSIALDTESVGSTNRTVGSPGWTT